ncbi:MAG: Calx-beta domain-containing protein, partial [Bacillota bacterium]
MFKKIIALVLIFSFSFSMLSPAFATEITDFSEEALRVSDEFAAQYPGGAFSLSAVAMETHEYSGRSVMNVVRQGGADGSITVTVKAIDVSAKYGQDYRLSIPGLILDKKIAGDETTPVIIQNGETEVAPADESVKDSVYPGVSESVYEVVGQSVYQSPKDNSDAGTVEIAGEIATEAHKSGGLRAVREQATGKASDREKLSGPDPEEREQLSTAVAAANDFYATAPGSVFTLSFADGERVKSFNLDIINDKIPEAQEQVVLVITGVTEGGFVGLQKETSVNIIDDEPYETPLIGFASPFFTAVGGSAKITLTRTSGVNYYAGGRISTYSDSARAGKDYTELGQKILFLPGQTELTVDIPVVKNESGADKYFYVKLEPDQSIILSGNESVQVRVPKAEKAVAQVTPRTGDAQAVKMTGDDVTAQAVPPDGVMLGESQKIFEYPFEGDFFGLKYNLISQTGNDNGHYVHGAGWYEGILIDKWQDAYYVLENGVYMSQLESVFIDAWLYDLGHSGNFHAWIDAGFRGYDANNPNQKNFYYTSSMLDPYHNPSDSDGEKRRQIMGRSWDIAKRTELLSPYARAVNDQWGDDFAARIYNFELNFRKFEFDIYPAHLQKVYTFDFSNGTNTYEEISPGEIEITTYDGTQLVKGFYTSKPWWYLKVKTKNVKPGWTLSELRFYKTDGTYTAIDMKGKEDYTPDYSWLQKYADTYGAGGKFNVVPYFEREEAGVSVYIPKTDKDKGEVLGWQSDGHIYYKDKTNAITLHAGDKVILTGFGKNSYAVEGYNVSYNNQTYKSESGSQNAGIYTITLTTRVKATPLFGAQQLNIKRDPSNKTQFPNLQGTITYGELTTTAEGQLGGIKSGQVVDFVSIPPAGHTTQWANRTGDTNGNGVLDYGEIHDPQTGELYRQFDFDGDGQLDAEYGDPMFGDLFGYKVNQPNPLFYYYYVPMAGQTIYNGKVTGRVLTREYMIRQGFTQVPDKRGKLVDKLVPVAGAAVKMGGSYDRTNPDAQMGYGTSTNSIGKFEFNVANVIKNANYLLGVDYNGVSYLDKINPSVTKELILPTFTSMEPLSIAASPHGGENPTVVSGSVVMVQDKDVSFTLITGSNENNVQVANAVFRVYSSNGTLASTTTVPVNVNKAVFTANLNEKFTPNARLTVQLVDQNGLQSMEFNTGFQFRPKLLEVAMLPGFAAPGEKAMPIVESVMGNMDLGLGKFLGENEANNGDSSVEITDDGYTLYLGIGRQLSQKSKTLKDTINKAVYGDSSAKNNIKSQNTVAKKKEDSNLKVKSTLNNKLGVKVSLKMSIKYDDTWTEADKDSGKATPYYFGDLMLMVTLEDTLSSETTVVLPVGISIIIKLDIGGAVTGFVYITPGTYFDMNTGKTVTKMIHADQNGSFPYFDSDKFDYEGGIILEPYISLTIGAVYGVAKVAVNGTAQFYLYFSTGRGGNGTVTLNAKVTASVLGFEVYKKTFANWGTNLFGDAQAQVANMFDIGDFNQSDFKPISRNYLNNRTGWTGDQPMAYMQSDTSAKTDFTENILMPGIYPDPDTQLMRIDGDSLLMVFIDDHPERSDSNRGGIYYSVSHNNGATFSQPILIDDDGTLDSHPRLIDLGNRIMLLYSSMDDIIAEGMSMEEILELNGLEMAFFDKETPYQFTAPVDVTHYTGRENPEGGLLGDYHSDVNGNAVYDEKSGQVMIIFDKTDYTSDADRDFQAEDLFNGYESIVYMLYDTNTGSFLPYEESDYPANLTTAEQKVQYDQDWYGQRFLETEITDDSLPGGVLSDPLVFDLTAKIKGRTAYIAYTVDMDGDLKTLQDREIYLQTYSFADKTFSSPFKISDMQEEVLAKADGKPQLLLYKGEMYLFFSADTAIYYYNLDNLFAELNNPDRPVAPGVALEYSAENLPTDDYKVLVGDDGKLYLIWTEETLRLADGVEPGSQESLKPENLYHEDQVFASMFYEKLYASKDTAEINHDYGKWSGKVQITAGPGSYDDPDVSVMANGQIILTAKKSAKILVDASSPREDNPDTAELVALTLTPIPQAEMNQDAITFATEYPQPGEMTTITAAASNHGLMPLLNPAVDFYVVQGETETLIDTVYNSAPVYGGY